MMLNDLLTEIERSRGAVTVAELAARLGTAPATVEAALGALRASGRLGPEGEATPGTHECASHGSCSLACPGPSECPFTVAMGTLLEIRRHRPDETAEPSLGRRPAGSFRTDR